MANMNEMLLNVSIARVRRALDLVLETFGMPLDAAAKLLLQKLKSEGVIEGDTNISEQDLRQLMNLFLLQKQEQVVALDRQLEALYK